METKLKELDQLLMPGNYYLNVSADEFDELIERNKENECYKIFTETKGSLIYKNLFKNSEIKYILKTLLKSNLMIDEKQINKIQNVENLGANYVLSGCFDFYHNDENKLINTQIINTYSNRNDFFNKKFNLYISEDLYKMVKTFAFKKSLNYSNLVFSYIYIDFDRLIENYKIMKKLNLNTFKIHFQIVINFNLKSLDEAERSQLLTFENMNETNIKKSNKIIIPHNEILYMFEKYTEKYE